MKVIKDRKYLFQRRITKFMSKWKTKIDLVPCFYIKSEILETVVMVRNSYCEFVFVFDLMLRKLLQTLSHLFDHLFEDILKQKSDESSSCGSVSFRLNEFTFLQRKVYFCLQLPRLLVYKKYYLYIMSFSVSRSCSCCVFYDFNKQFVLLSSEILFADRCTCSVCLSGE